MKTIIRRKQFTHIAGAGNDINAKLQEVVNYAADHAGGLINICEYKEFSRLSDGARYENHCWAVWHRVQVPDDAPDEVSAEPTGALRGFEV